MLYAFVLSSCRREDEALTGNLKIIIPANFDLNIYYQLYPEGTWKPDLLISPLRSGQFEKGVALIRDLNPGNYIVVVNANAKSVQVTAGREREYKY